jgi:PII-like signaling protein
MSDGVKHGVFHTPEPAKRLRIYVGESDKYQGLPLYEAVVLKARELHMAGATVLRGPMGFGANSRIHTAKILRLSEDLPILIEIVDAADKVRAFVPHLESMLTGGLVTIEDVGVLIYSPSSSTR